MDFYCALFLSIAAGEMVRGENMASLSYQKTDS
jgi:hypothetical protein